MGALRLYLASGCFWGREYNLRQLPGVIRTRVGFAGGTSVNPTYQQVCTGNTGHTETVELVFDPTRLAPASVLTEFFTLHDSTIDRGGADGLGKYRSAIFTLRGDPGAEDLLQTAANLVAILAAGGVRSSTQIGLIDAFYPASARHQQYCSARGVVPSKRRSGRIRELLTPSPGGDTASDGQC